MVSLCQPTAAAAVAAAAADTATPTATTTFTCNLPPFLTITTLKSNPFTTTDPATSTPSYLSPRALEKQPVRDVYAVNAPDTLPPSSFDYSSFFSTSHRPSATPYDPPDLTLAQPQPPVQRRSFLESLLVRQKKVIAPDNRSTASKVLFPINYIPVQPRSQFNINLIINDRTLPSIPAPATFILSSPFRSSDALANTLPPTPSSSIARD